MTSNAWPGSCPFCSGNRLSASGAEVFCSDCGDRRPPLCPNASLHTSPIDELLRRAETAEAKLRAGAMTKTCPKGHFSLLSKTRCFECELETAEARLKNAATILKEMIGSLDPCDRAIRGDMCECIQCAAIEALHRLEDDDRG